MMRRENAHHAYYRVKNMTRTSELEENSGNSRITVSLGADVSEGYVLRYELHPAEHFTFTAMTLGLETPQQLGERLAAQVIATSEEREEQPGRMDGDLYTKLPTTYALHRFARKGRRTEKQRSSIQRPTASNR